MFELNYPHTEEMRIHSLNGEMREATLLAKVGDNDYIAEYNGKKCHAIYNPFRGCFYVDDKYSVVKEKQHKRNEPCR